MTHLYNRTVKETRIKGFFKLLISPQILSLIGGFQKKKMSSKLEVYGGRAELTFPVHPKTFVIFATLVHVLLFS